MQYILIPNEITKEFKRYGRSRWTITLIYSQMVGVIGYTKQNTVKIKGKWLCETLSITKETYLKHVRTLIADNYLTVLASKTYAVPKKAHHLYKQSMCGVLNYTYLDNGLSHREAVLIAYISGRMSRAKIVASYAWLTYKAVEEDIAINKTSWQSAREKLAKLGYISYEFVDDVYNGHNITKTYFHPGITPAPKPKAKRKAPKKKAKVAKVAHTEEVPDSQDVYSSPAKTHSHEAFSWSLADTIGTDKVNLIHNWLTFHYTNRYYELEGVDGLVVNEAKDFKVLNTFKADMFSVAKAAKEGRGSGVNYDPYSVWSLARSRLFPQKYTVAQAVTAMEPADIVDTYNLCIHVLESAYAQNQKAKKGTSTGRYPSSLNYLIRKLLAKKDIQQKKVNVVIDTSQYRTF